MSTGLITIYNSFLYYSCLLLLAYYILNCTARRHILLCSFLSFVPLIIFSLPNQDFLLYPAYIVFQIIQFVFVKISFKGVKLSRVIFSYVVLYCVNVLLTSLLVPFVSQHFLYLDTCINTLVVVLWAVICITRIRYIVQQVLDALPGYVMVTSAFLLVVAALMSVLISYFQLGDFPVIWNRWIQTLTSFLLMAICLVVPIIFIISISNTRLKTLTANYEQQIHAQAEHYKNLAEANYEVRRFHHDFKNIRIAIEKLAEQGKYSEIIDYLRKSAETLEHPGGSACSFDTGNGIADALLTDKQERAALQNTQLVFQGAIPAESLSPTDLCVILGNSLDNALDACSKLPPQNGKIISVCCKSCGGFLFLTITNPIADKVVIRNNAIPTTKENKTLHGFGLYSLRTVVKKYDGEIQLSTTEDTFTVSIDLCITPTPHKIPT